MSSSFNIIDFLKKAVASGASDEHLKVGHPPFIRKNGAIKKIDMPIISKEELEKAVLDIAPMALVDTLNNHLDLDFMFEIKGCSRFRVNYNRQMGMPGLVIRNIPYEIPRYCQIFKWDNFSNRSNW